MKIQVVLTLDVTPEEIRSNNGTPLQAIIEKTIERHIHRTLAFFMKSRVEGKDKLHIRMFGVGRGTSV